MSLYQAKYRKPEGTATVALDDLEVELDVTYATSNVTFHEIAAISFDDDESELDVIHVTDAPPDDTDW